LSLAIFFFCAGYFVSFSAVEPDGFSSDMLAALVDVALVYEFLG
jgi:hypothetical protein